MRALKTVSSVLLLAISLYAQGQKPAENSEDVLLQEIKFVGVRQVPLAALRKLAAIYEGKPYDANEISELEERVRDLYQQYGFFKVLITRDETATSGSHVRPTPIVFEVVEGRRYRLGTIRFENGKAFTSAALRPLFPIQAGEIFNTAKIRKGLENLRKVYGARGYINFTPVPDTSVDDVNGTVSLTIDLDEGAQYRVGKVTFVGGSPKLRERLNKDWKLPPNAPYDTDYIMKFFKDHRALVPASVWQSAEVIQNKENNTVDVIFGLGDE
ncbi:MAG: hypothetical protein L0Z53_14115 [Acidobacteriales bacterium]|nr:hypothetical protein [Terriglobales bacterium]